MIGAGGGVYLFHFLLNLAPRTLLGMQVVVNNYLPNERKKCCPLTGNRNHKGSQSAGTEHIVGNYSYRLSLPLVREVLKRSGMVFSPNKSMMQKLSLRGSKTVISTITPLVCYGMGKDFFPLKCIYLIGKFPPESTLSFWPQLQS